MEAYTKIKKNLEIMIIKLKVLRKKCNPINSLVKENDELRHNKKIVKKNLKQNLEKKNIYFKKYKKLFQKSKSLEKMLSYVDNTQTIHKLVQGNETLSIVIFQTKFRE